MNKRRTIFVRDVMSDRFSIMDGRATVQDGLDEMKHSHVRAIIVSKRHENDTFGIVLLSDIAKKVLGRNRSRSRTNLYEIMSKPVLSVDSGMDIRYCARLFQRFGINTAPVIEGGEIHGVVAYDQLVLKGLARQS